MQLPTGLRTNFSQIKTLLAVGAIFLAALLALPHFLASAGSKTSDKNLRDTTVEPKRIPIVDSDRHPSPAGADPETFVYAINGKAFKLIETAGGPVVTPIKTSLPAFQAFSVSRDGNHLLYSPLKNGRPSGQLLVEELSKGTRRIVTTKLILAAAMSPVNPELIAFTFSGDTGFGLALADLSSGSERNLVDRGVYSEILRWEPSGNGIGFFLTTEHEEFVQLDDATLPNEPFSKFSDWPDSKLSRSIVRSGDPVNGIKFSPKRVSIDGDLGSFTLGSIKGFPTVNDTPQEPIVVPRNAQPADKGSVGIRSFVARSVDGRYEISGNDLAGSGRLVIKDSTSALASSLESAILIRVLGSGVAVRQFDDNRTITKFVDWNGNQIELGVVVVDHTLPLANSKMIQGGSSYSSPGNCNLTAHTEVMGYAYDFQTLSVGAHALATADGLVVYTDNSVTCNSAQVGCVDYNPNGCGGFYLGNQIVIQHLDGTYSSFSHLQTNSIRAETGTSVCRGLYVAQQGHTGTTTGPFNGCGDHVHFQRQVSPDPWSQSIPVTFSDVVSHPLQCGATYNTSSTELAHSISDTGASFPIAGGNGSVDITSTGCSWEVASSVNWISIVSAASGTGNATISYSVADNSTSGPRSGVIRVAGHRYTVTQAGGATTNLAPQVNAGTDNVTDITTGVSLSGSISDDGLPNPPAAVTLSWTKIRGPGSVTFSNPSGSQTNAAFSLAGIYTLRLTANDGALTSFDDVQVVVNISGAGGTLTASHGSPPATVDLTAEGTADWVHWGIADVSSVSRKNVVTPLISDVTRIGPIVTLRSSNNGFPTETFSWTDGTAPNVSASTTACIYTYGKDNGFELTAPADTTLRTLKLHVGVWQTRGRLEAELSDGSYSPFLDNSLATIFPAGSITAVYTITYSAASAGQTLRVRWVVENSFYPVGNVTLQAATLLDNGVPPNFPPSVDAGQDQSITLPSAATLSGSVSDDGLPIPPGTHTSTWSQVSGNGTAAFGDPSQLNTSVSFNAPGVYVLRLTASDGSLTTTDDVTIAVNSQGGAGSLVVNGASPPSTVDLTAEGSSDWAHWGLNGISMNRKSGATQQISDFVGIGPGPKERFAGNSVLYNWSDGSPTQDATNVDAGIWTTQYGSGYQITVPADTALRTLKLYVGLWSAGGRLEASLSDFSAPIFIDTSLSNSTGTTNWVYSLNFQAASPGQTLNVKWTVNTVFNVYSNVTLQAATLSHAGPANSPPTVNAGPDQTVTAPNAAQLNGTAIDDGNPNPPGALSITWSKVSGPGNVDFNDPASASTNATFSTPGTYVLRLSAFDGVLISTDDVIVVVNAASGSGALVVSTSIPSANVDLSVEGTLDWAHWGYTGTSMNRKANVTPLISDFTGLGTGPKEQFTGNSVHFDWNDGSPVPSASNVDTGVWTTQLGSGYQITVPADTTTKTLKIYLGLWSAGGRFEAFLSDFSAPTYLDTSLVNPGATSNVVYALDYRAASAGQVLTVRWTNNTVFNAYSNVTLQAATLAQSAVNQLPTANAGSNQTVNFPSTANLAGTASDDGLPAPPATLTTAWSKVSGPGTVTFGNANQLITTASFSAAGVYVLRLTASDSSLSTTSDVTITVNQPPTVSAAADQTITLPNTATLGGTASDDGLPNPPSTLTRSWSVVSGPGTVTFTNPAALNPIASFSTSGVYVLRLSVDDGSAVSTDDVQITVNPSSGVGTLTGSTANAPVGNINLTTDGPGDWAHWGLGSASDFNQKAVSTMDISDYISVGSGTESQLTGSTTTFSWNDGAAPVVSTPATGTGVKVNGVGNGFEFTVPADTVSRGVKVYLGLSEAGGTLEATLSDGSAVPIVDATLVNNTGVSNYVYSINYRAASSGQTLTLKWTVNSMADTDGFVSIQAATLGDLYECDVAPRPLGSRTGLVNNTDVIQMRRFFQGTDTPNLNNEFQRGDCSTLGPRGNNVINNTDIIQTRRFFQGIDAVPTAAGPSPSGLLELIRPPVSIITDKGTIFDLAADDLTVSRVSLSGNKVIVGVYLQSVGDAVGASFTLNWDPAVLTSPANVTLGSGAVGYWQTVSPVTSQVGSGRLGIGIESDGNESNKLPSGLRQILSVEFTIQAGAPSSTQIGFGATPTPLGISVLVSGTLDERPPNVFSGNISLLNPTAAPVTIGGRVVDGQGTGIGRAKITLSDPAGLTWTSATNTFGYYKFNDLRAGITYTVTASPNKYGSAPQSRVITALDEVSDLDFRFEDAQQLIQVFSQELAADDLTVSRVSLNGNALTVGVYLQSVGDAVGASFSLTWDPAILTSPTNVTLGSGAINYWSTIPSGNINTSQVGSGRLGIAIESDGTDLNRLPSGLRQIVAVTFTVQPAPPGSTSIGFGDQPTGRLISVLVNGDLGDRPPNTFTGNISLLNPTAAPVSICGRIVGPTGIGFSRIPVSLAGPFENARVTYSNAFGYYCFEDLRIGTYSVSANSRKHVFDPPQRTVMAFDNVVDANFSVQD